CQNGFTKDEIFIKRRLIAADQASFFMALTFEQRSSGLVLHQMVSAENNTSGPVP
ncbi:hypothetical protein Tco_1251018, partial [Tanacetum coccineum]